MAALSRLKPTRLERALVLQAWMVVQGSARDVVIGVPQGGMKVRSSPRLGRRHGSIVHNNFPRAAPHSTQHRALISTSGPTIHG